MIIITVTFMFINYNYLLILCEEIVISEISMGTAFDYVSLIQGRSISCCFLAIANYDVIAVSLLSLSMCIFNRHNSTMQNL